VQASDFKNLGVKPFNKGLSGLGNNIYCYLQSDGGMGWSNAGLIVDGDAERIAVNVNSLYKEYKGGEQREEITLLFEQMPELSGLDG